MKPVGMQMQSAMLLCVIQFAGLSRLSAVRPIAAGFLGLWAHSVEKQQYIQAATAGLSVRQQQKTQKNRHMDLDGMMLIPQHQALQFIQDSRVPPISYNIDTSVQRLT